RRRRARKALEALEQDNYHDDPHADLEKAHHPDPPNYQAALVGPSEIPQRHFCAVCGFPSNYTCIPCGTRYCSVRCLGIHQETRCLKWTA
ncbi:hypothetical protein B566_EDAN018328, partial [Ephemera danica]